MKKFLFIFYFLFFIICTAFSQPIWYESNPYPSPNNIRVLYFINSSTGFGAGEWGIFIKTTNSGINWTPLPCFTHDWIFSLAFQDANTGLAGGSDYVYRTTDGGYNWAAVLSNQDYQYNNAAYIGNNTYILSASNYYSVGRNMVFRTTNSGTQWTSQTYETDTAGYMLSTIRFLNNSTGFINEGYSYSNGNYYFRLLKTTDSGNNWNNIFGLISNYAVPGAIAFLNDNTGFAVGNNYYIGKTTDGGFNWTTLKYYQYNSDYWYNCIRFLNQNTGIICGVNSLRTVNGGTNWIFMDSANIISTYDVSFLDNNNVIMTGYNGRIYVSGNTGANWSRIDKKLSGSDYFLTLTGCILLNPSTAIVGTGTSIYKTTNSGLNWSIDTTVYAGKFYFVNSGMGMTVNTQGYAVYRTTNGGQTWTDKTTTGFNDKYYDLKFIDAQTGIVAGYNTTSGNMVIKLTTNGGDNWQRITNNTTGGTRACEMIDLNTFYVGSDNIYKTTDGGGNWVKQTNYYSGGFNFFFIRFINSNTGFAGGREYTYPTYPGILYKTTNGGLNWVNVYTDNLFFPVSINIISNKMYLTFFGAINSANIGKISVSTDSGISWNKQYESNNGALNSVSFCDSIHGLVCGEQELILFTYPPGTITAAKNISADVPKKFELMQNYPNPFNPTTVIKYSIPSRDLSSPNAPGGDLVTLKVYDILGREVKTLVNEKQNAGTYEITFDGSKLSSGIYFYTLTVGDSPGRAGEFRETKKMLLIK